MQICFFTYIRDITPHNDTSNDSRTLLIPGKKNTTMADLYRVLNDNTRGGDHIDGFGVKKIPT
jgi:hypothetical protein